MALPRKEELVLQPLFETAGVEGTFVMLYPRNNVLRGYNRVRAEQRFSPASTFKIPDSLIALSLGVVANPDALIPYKGDPNPFMLEWLAPMGMRGAIKVSNVPLYQELARRIGLPRMHSALRRLHYGNEQIGDDVTTFWLLAVACDCLASGG